MAPRGSTGNNTTKLNEPEKFTKVFIILIQIYPTLLFFKSKLKNKIDTSIIINKIQSSHWAR